MAAHAVPLDLAPILRADLFDRVETAVVTSATLATQGGFGFLQQRLGLDGGPNGDTPPKAKGRSGKGQRHRFPEV